MEERGRRTDGTRGGGWIFNGEKRSGGDGDEGAEERSVTAMCVTLCGSMDV